MKLRGRWRNRRAGVRSDAGQALVETALAVPIFLILVLAIVEGAAYAFAITSVQHATHEGGRLAALPDTTTETVVKARVTDRAAPIEVSSEDIAVSVNSGATPFSLRETGDRVHVTVTIDYQPLTSAIFGGLTFAVSADAEYRVE